MDLLANARSRWSSAIVLTAAGSCVLAVAAVGAEAFPAGAAVTSDERSGAVALAPDGGTVEEPFRAEFNRRIPTNPVLDGGSRKIVDYLAGEGVAYANLYDYGTPIYTVDSGTPGVDVECLRSWGPCDLEQRKVPVPAGAEPNAGSDGAMVVVDADTGDVFEFWQAEPVDNGWQTSWGEIVSVTGRGGDGSTGSGISRLAGIIRTDEIAAGVIPHALVLSTDNACSKGFRAPATKTDGASDRGDCIPEGARLQLSPNVDIDRLSLSDGERAVAVALQRYGAYVIDNGAARMAFMFENPTDGVDPYQEAGLLWDYFAMEDIPWSRLRVLNSWNGS